MIGSDPNLNETDEKNDNEQCSEETIRDLFKFDELCDNVFNGKCGRINHNLHDYTSYQNSYGKCDKINHNLHDYISYQKAIPTHKKDVFIHKNVSDKSFCINDESRIEVGLFYTDKTSKNHLPSHHEKKNNRNDNKTNDEDKEFNDVKFNVNESDDESRKINHKCNDYTIHQNIIINSQGKQSENDLSSEEIDESLFDNVKENSNCNLNSNESERENSYNESHRVIIDFQYVFNEIQKAFKEHITPTYKCLFENWLLISEKRLGLKTQFHFHCSDCNYECRIMSEPTTDLQYMDINTAAVASTIVTGMSYAQLKELLAGMSIHCFSDKTYFNLEQSLLIHFSEAAVASMDQAAEEEKLLASERGDITSTNVHFTKVTIDGSWSKRSYGTNYNSASGMTSIVGWYSGKVLYFGIRNKYCLVCVRAENAQKKNQKSILAIGTGMLIIRQQQWKQILFWKVSNVV